MSHQAIERSVWRHRITLYNHSRNLPLSESDPKYKNNIHITLKSSVLAYCIIYKRPGTFTIHTQQVVAFKICWWQQMDATSTKCAHSHRTPTRAQDTLWNGLWHVLYSEHANCHHLDVTLCSLHKWAVMFQRNTVFISTMETFIS